MAASEIALGKIARARELEQERKIVALIPAERRRLNEEVNPHKVSFSYRQRLKRAEALITRALANPGNAELQHKAIIEQEIVRRERPELNRHLAWIAAKNWKAAPQGAKPIPDHPLFLVTPSGEAFSLIGGNSLVVGREGDIAVKGAAKIQLAKAVANCFLPNPLGRKRVEALDGNICNANVSNLRWKEPRRSEPKKRQQGNPAARARAKAAVELQKRKGAALKRGVSVAEATAIR